MNDKVIIANYITAYEIRSVDDMERQFVLNENVLYDVAEEMWSCTLETIASAVVFRAKIEGPPHFCKQPKRYFEKIRGYTAEDSKIFARRICTASGVYRHFDKIIQNISKCRFIDIRRLSIKDLYECQTLSRALVLDCAKRPRSSQTVRNEELQGYSEADYNDLLVTIQESPAFRGVEGDKNKTSNLLVRVANALTARQ